MFLRRKLTYEYDQMHLTKKVMSNESNVCMSSSVPVAFIVGIILTLFF